MDAQRLSFIAEHAVLTVFRFHNKNTELLDVDYQYTLREAIEDLWPLRCRAKSLELAHLEIASDAAVTCVELFNKRNPEKAMNKRWVYSCVQNLLSFELQPGLLLDGRVERLRMSEQSQDGEEEDDNRRRIRSNSTSAPSSSSATLMDHGSSGDFGDDDGMDIDYEVDDDDGDVIMSIEQADDGDSDQGSKGKSIMVTPTKKKLSSPDSAPVAKKKEPKTPWTEDDIKRMITLKDFEGFTHEEVAVRIGRGKGSVENKYGRVVKDDKWKLYAEACRMQSGRNSRKRRAGNDKDKDDVDDDDVDGDGKKATRHQAPRKKQQI